MKMDEELVIKYIRTKNKVRKIVTYKENSELRIYHQKVVEYLKKHTYNSIFAKAIYHIHQYMKMLEQICIMIYL